MSWQHTRAAWQREQRELEISLALIHDAIKDTAQWLTGGLSEEERIHVLAVQQGLNGLANRRTANGGPT
jgi:hypothetical protein